MPENLNFDHSDRNCRVLLQPAISDQMPECCASHHLKERGARRTTAGHLQVSKCEVWALAFKAHHTLQGEPLTRREADTMSKTETPYSLLVR